MEESPVLEELLEPIDDASTALSPDLTTVSLQLDDILSNQNLQIQLDILLLAVVAAFFVAYAIFRYLK